MHEISHFFGADEDLAKKVENHFSTLGAANSRPIRALISNVELMKKKLKTLKEQTATNEGMAVLEYCSKVGEIKGMVTVLQSLAASIEPPVTLDTYRYFESKFDSFEKAWLETARECDSGISPLLEGRVAGKSNKELIERINLVPTNDLDEVGRMGKAQLKSTAAPAE
jgi:hypothetical protein